MDNNSVKNHFTKNEKGSFRLLHKEIFFYQFQNPTGYSLNQGDNLKHKQPHRKNLGFFGQKPFL